jgi:hypothetical protein
VLRSCLDEGRPYVEFMTHSSHLMPGGGPAFVSAKDVERVYAHLEEFFSVAADCTLGATLTEYYEILHHKISRADNTYL